MKWQSVHNMLFLKRACFPSDLRNTVLAHETVLGLELSRAKQDCARTKRIPEAERFRKACVWLEELRSYKRIWEDEILGNRKMPSLYGSKSGIASPDGMYALWHLEFKHAHPRGTIKQWFEWCGELEYAYGQAGNALLVRDFQCYREYVDLTNLSGMKTTQVARGLGRVEYHHT